MINKIWIKMIAVFVVCLFSIDTTFGSQQEKPSISTLAPFLRVQKEDFKTAYRIGYTLLAQKAANEIIGAYIRDYFRILPNQKADISQLPQYRIEKVNVIFDSIPKTMQIPIVGVPDLLKSTGQFGHVGLGWWNEKLVIYVDSKYFYVENDALKHEREEVAKWEVKRLELEKEMQRPISYKELRSVIRETGKAKEWRNDFHDSSTSLAILYLDAQREAPDFIDLDKIYDLYYKYGLDEEDDDFNISASKASEPLGHIIACRHLSPGDEGQGEEGDRLYSSIKEELSQRIKEARRQGLNPIVISETGLYPEILELFKEWAESGTFSPATLRSKAVQRILCEAHVTAKRNFLKTYRKFFEGSLSASQAKAEPIITAIRDVARGLKVDVLPESVGLTQQEENEFFLAMQKYLLATFFYWPKVIKAWEEGDSREAEKNAAEYLEYFCSGAAIRDHIIVESLKRLHQKDRTAFPIIVRGLGHTQILSIALSNHNISYRVTEDSTKGDIDFLDLAAIKFLENKPLPQVMDLVKRAAIDHWLKEHFNCEPSKAYNLLKLLPEEIITSFFEGLDKGDRHKGFSVVLKETVSQIIVPACLALGRPELVPEGLLAYQQQPKKDWDSFYKEYEKAILSAETVEELKLIRRRIALACHPDRNPGDKKAEKTFKELWEISEKRVPRGKKQKAPPSGDHEREAWEWEEEMDNWVKSSFGPGYRFSSPSAASASIGYKNENEALIKPAMEELERQQNKTELAVVVFNLLEPGQIFHFQDWNNMRSGSKVGSGVLGTGTAIRAIVLSKSAEEIKYLSLGPPYQDMWADEPQNYYGVIKFRDVKEGRIALAEEPIIKTKGQVGIGTFLEFKDFKEQPELTWRYSFPVTLVSRINFAWIFVSPRILHKEVTSGLGHKTFIPTDMLANKIENSSARVISSYADAEEAGKIDKKALTIQAALKLRSLGIPSEFLVDFIEDEAWKIKDREKMRPLWRYIDDVVEKIFKGDSRSKKDWSNIVIELKKLEQDIGDKSQKLPPERSRISSYHKVFEIPRNRAIVEVLKGFLPQLRADFSFSPFKPYAEVDRRQPFGKFEAILHYKRVSMCEVYGRAGWSSIMYCDGLPLTVKSGIVHFGYPYQIFEDEQNVYVILADLSGDKIQHNLDDEEINAALRSHNLFEFPGESSGKNLKVTTRFNAQRLGWLTDDDFLLLVLETALKVNDILGGLASDRLIRYRQRLEEALIKGDFNKLAFYEGDEENRNIDDLIMKCSQMTLDSSSIHVIKALETALQLISPKRDSIGVLRLIEGKGVEKPEKPDAKGCPAELLEALRLDDKLLQESLSEDGVTISEIVAKKSCHAGTVYKEFELLIDLSVFVPIDGKPEHYRFSDMMIGPDLNYTKTMINAVCDIRYQAGIKDEARPLYQSDISEDKKSIVKELIRMTVLNQLNLMQKPAIPENKVLWHIIEHSILSPSQQSSSFIQTINNVSRESQAPERIWLIGRDESIEQAIAGIRKICTNPVFDVALSSPAHIDDVPTFKVEDKIKILVFEGSASDFRQLGGVVAALRALHLPEEEVIPALLQVYTIMKGTPYTGKIPSQSLLNNPRRFARQFIFDLPPIIDLPINEIPKMNDRLLQLLIAA